LLGLSDEVCGWLSDTAHAELVAERWTLPFFPVAENIEDDFGYYLVVGWHGNVKQQFVACRCWMILKIA